MSPRPEHGDAYAANHDGTIQYAYEENALATSFRRLLTHRADSIYWHRDGDDPTTRIHAMQVTIEGESFLLEESYPSTIFGESKTPKKITLWHQQILNGTTISKILTWERSYLDPKRSMHITDARIEEDTGLKPRITSVTDRGEILSLAHSLYMSL